MKLASRQKALLTSALIYAGFLNDCSACSQNDGYPGRGQFAGEDAVGSAGQGYRRCGLAFLGHAQHVFTCMPGSQVRAKRQLALALV